MIGVQPKGGWTPLAAAVADRFVSTVVPIPKKYNFDGIDIDIETGLTGSGNIGQLSASQANLIRVIDGILAQMPSDFGLTMAPETAYVTGGSITYGSIWGAYLPVIKKYADNGRLWWAEHAVLQRRHVRLFR
nr:glycosyl hydrolase family 18 protein [Streptomyces dangxiongensis]